nr:hypothetical protein [uncultured Actinoplanes sp.]
MRSLGTRRVALAAGAATVAVISLAGCSAGQVAETALLQAPVSGLNTASPDGSLLIRNLQVIYNGPEGYPANSSAPVEMSLFNQTQSPITVQISSRPRQTETQDVVSAQQVGLTGGAAAASPSANPEPSGSRQANTTPIPSEQVPESGAPTTPAGSASASPVQPGAALQPARITIPALGSATFMPGDQQTVQLVGLSDRLAPGGSASIVFEVSTSNQPLELLAPVAVPLSPGSRAPGLPEEENLGEGGADQGEK